MTIFTPPFIVTGENDAVFYCLAFTPTLQHSTSKGDISTSTGLYLCQHPEFSALSLHGYAQDARPMLYHRLENGFDSVPGGLLWAREYYGICAGSWRLFPLPPQPEQHLGPRASDYFAARSLIFRLIYPFRVHPFPIDPTQGLLKLVRPDVTHPFLKLGDDEAESVEFDKMVQDSE